MSTRTRILLVAAGIVVLIGVGIAIYFLFLRGNAGLSIGGADFPGAGDTNDEDATNGDIQDVGVAANDAGTELAPRFVRISDRPVALGAVAIYISGKDPVQVGSTTEPGVDPDVRVQYIERESGNVYVYTAHTRTLTRLSNKTLPGAQEASWLSDGSLAFVRFLEKSGEEEHLDTYALPSGGENGYFLEQDLDQVLTRGSTTLVTLLSTTDGSSASISSPTGAGLRSLFTTPLSSIRLGFLGSNYLVSTKGSAKMGGYAFIADGKTGAFTRVLGPLPGLSTLPSPGGKYVLYSYVNQGKLALGVLDTATRVATRLPLSTLPEKCVWTEDDVTLYCGVPTAPTGTLPDDWYQGATSFTDRIWRIDMAGRVATLIIDPKETAEIDVDAVGLTLDRTNDVLVFTNKRDHLLYIYDL